MAIRMIDGIPGSGKSFYAVKHLVDNYYDLDHAGFYVPKPFVGRDGQVQKLIIVTNLEGFQLPSVSLEDEMKVAGGVRVFWSHSYQEKIEKPDERRIYIVDEAQKYFRRKLSGDWDDVFFYFEKHRHFGHDIYLLTQNPKKVNVELTDLLEYRIHAKPRVRSVTGEFPYQMICDGDVMKRFGYRPDPKIFALYQSRRKGETEKIHNPVIRFVLMASVAILVVGFGGYYTFKSRMLPGAGEAQAGVVPVIQSRSSGSVVPVSGSVASSVPAVDYSSSVLVPLSVATQFVDGRAVVTYFVENKFYPEIGFPFPLQKIGSRNFAVIDKVLYSVLFPDRKDSSKNSLNGPSRENQL